MGGTGEGGGGGWCDPESPTKPCFAPVSGVLSGMLINGNALVVLAPHKNLEKIKSSMNCFRWKAGTAGGDYILY